MKHMKTGATTVEGLTRRNFIKGGAGAVLAVGCLHGFELHTTAKGANLNRNAARTYICPPCGQACDKLTFDQPGNCPQCGMTLIPADGEGGPPKVAILIFVGAEIIDFSGPWEAFGTAGFLVHTVAAGTEPHMMVFGQRIVPDYTFLNSPKSD